MKFLIHKRRTAPAVIIVALIDVLIVLVIFLLVTTMFKQQQYMVKLAESSQAQKTGANWLVVGRPIYAAENPRAAAEKILASIC